MEVSPPKRGRPRKVRPAPGIAKLRLNRTGLHERAVEHLRGLIVHGELAPGANLVETELGDRLGVSRTPLREALKLLAVEGLIELRLNRSPRVMPMDPADIADLFEAVGGIERVAAEMAADRITPDELQRLRELQEAIERHHAAGDLHRYFDVNQQIHVLIVRASKNRSLEEAHGRLLGRAERARYFALGSGSRWDESVVEHRQVLDALNRRDAEDAGRRLREHVMRTGQIVSSALQAGTSVGAGSAISNEAPPSEAA